MGKHMKKLRIAGFALPTPLIAALVCLATVAVASTLVYFMTDLGVSITISTTAYPCSLWTDDTCTEPLVELAFDTIYETIIPGPTTRTTDWIECYVRNDAIPDGEPEEVIYLHWILPSAPDGVTVTFEKWRDVQEVWDGAECEFSTEIMGSNCDGSYGTQTGGGNLFRFKLTIDATVEVGDITLGLEVYTASETLVTP